MAETENFYRSKTTIQKPEGVTAELHVTARERDGGQYYTALHFEKSAAASENGQTLRFIEGFAQEGRNYAEQSKSKVTFQGIESTSVVLLDEASGSKLTTMEQRLSWADGKKSTEIHNTISDKNGAVLQESRFYADNKGNMTLTEIQEKRAPGLVGFGGERKVSEMAFKDDNAVVQIKEYEEKLRGITPTEKERQMDRVLVSKEVHSDVTRAPTEADFVKAETYIAQLHQLRELAQEAAGAEKGMASNNRETQTAKAPIVELER